MDRSQKFEADRDKLEKDFRKFIKAAGKLNLETFTQDVLATWADNPDDDESDGRECIGSLSEVNLKDTDVAEDTWESEIIIFLFSLSFKSFGIIVSSCIRIQCEDREQIENLKNAIYSN